MVLGMPPDFVSRRTVIILEKTARALRFRQRRQNLQILLAKVRGLRQQRFGGSSPQPPRQKWSDSHRDVLWVDGLSGGRVFADGHRVTLRPRRCRSFFRDKCSQLVPACLPKMVRVAGGAFETLARSDSLSACKKTVWYGLMPSLGKYQSDI